MTIDPQRLGWAEDVQVLPEGYAPAEVTPPAEFTVAYGENHQAPLSERFAVAAGRTLVLEGRATPMPGEPFTEFYGRRKLAERRFTELANELLRR